MPTIPEEVFVTSLSGWEENFLLLQEYIEHNPRITGDAPEFWLLTTNPKLNQWLVYNKVELKKARNQRDPVWMDRKMRLGELGVLFSQIFRLTSSSRRRRGKSEEEHSFRTTKRSSTGKSLLKKDQAWTGWVRHVEEEYYEYVPTMKNFYFKSRRTLPQAWLPPNLDTRKSSITGAAKKRGYTSRLIALATNQTKQLAKVVAIAA